MNNNINSNSVLILNIENLRAMKKEMLEISKELEESCKECYRRVDESKEIYDTSTATYFREQATEFVLKNQKYMENVVIPYINQLDLIIKEYEGLFSDIEQSMGNKVI